MDIGGGNEASKCSKTGIEESDQSEISKHSSGERSAGTGDHAYPGGGIGSNPTCFNSDVDDGIGSSKVISSEPLRFSSSSSSSSLSFRSSGDDRSRADTKLPDDHVSGSSTSKSKAPDLMRNPTMTQSPSVQVMDRVEGYDPHRIPASIFERNKSGTPGDWSINSNDSLFSIQVEDNSLSRDPSLNLKSGELFRSHELFTIHQSPLASPMHPDNTLKNKTGPSAEEPIEEKPARFWSSPTPSNHSDQASVQSFAFPVLDGRNAVSKEEKRERRRRQEQDQDQDHEQEQDQDQDHEQDQDQDQEQSLEPASPTESSCCGSWSSCFRRRWRCCNWNWLGNWNWRRFGSRCCRGK